MALITRKGVITAPTTNGNTVNTDLSAVFSAGEPIRAIILWCENATAAGTTDGDGIFSFGFVTNNGGSIQQGYISYFEDDAAGSGANARGINNTACLKTFSANATPTVDMEVDLTTFNDDDFTLTFTDAPAAAIKIHYFAIGGSDVTAARTTLQTQTASQATQEFTVTSGFGQPDLIFIAHRSTGTTGGDNGASNAGIGIGVGIGDVGSRQTSHSQITGNTNMLGGATQGANILSQIGTPSSVPTIQAEAALSAKSGWPTDGYELTYSTQAAGDYPFIDLALKGDFTATVGAGTALTAGSTDDLAHSTTPTGAFFWGWPLAAQTGLRDADADLNGMHVYASDGTNEGGAFVGSNEGVGTSNTGRAHSESKSMQFYVQSTTTPTLNSEADGSVSGSNFRLTWNDLDTVARQYNYLLLGSGGGTTHTGSASLAIAAAVATNGVRTTFGASAVPITVGIATAGAKTTFGTVAVPVTLTVATAGRRGTTGAASLPIMFGADANGVRTTSGAASLPITLDVFTAGTSTNGGTATLGLTLAIVTAGTVVKRGRVDLPLTLDVATSGTKSTTGSAALPLTLTTATEGTLGAYGTASLPILFTVTVDGNQPEPPSLPEIAAGSIAESAAGAIGRGGYGRIAPPHTGGI